MTVQPRATGQRWNLSTRSLSEETVRAILTSNVRISDMARQCNVSRETVRRVRYGYTYVDVLPDLPRWEEPKPRQRRAVYNQTCWNCAHGAYIFERKNDKWRATQRKVVCGLGLPDPLKEGARFARWCAAYSKAPAGQEPACIRQEVAA